MDPRLQKALLASNVDVLKVFLNSESQPVATNPTVPTTDASIDINPPAPQARTDGFIVRSVPRLLESRILRGVTPTGDGVLHIAARLGCKDQVLAILRNARVVVDEHDEAAAAAAGTEEGQRLAAGNGGGQAGEASTHTTVEVSTGMLFAEFLRARNKMGETCLHEAISSGKNKLVDLLLSVDAKVNANSPGLLQILDHDGTSPLYLATTLRMVDIVKAFTANNDMYSLSSAGPQGRTALHAAVLLGTELCEPLLTWNTSLAKKGDNLGRTPIHYLGMADAAIAELLLEKDSSTGYSADSEGWLPIHVAASRGRLDIMRALVDKCPDCILLCNKSGQTFLHVAVDEGHSNVVGYACRENKFSIILNMRDVNGDTALHMAVQKGDEFIVWRLLTNNNVCLSIINRQGQTPLDLAILGIALAPKFKYKWEWIRDDLVYMGADLSACRWDDLKASKVRWGGPINNPIKPNNLPREVLWDCPIKILREVILWEKLVNLIRKIERDGLIKVTLEIIWDYYPTMKGMREKTDHLVFSSSTILERDDEKESERLGKAAAVLAAAALLILTLSFQAPFNAADKKRLSTEPGHATTRTFVRLVPVDTVSMAAAVLSIFFCTIAGFPTGRFWIRSKALLLGGILLGTAAVAILLVFSLGLSLVYDYPRWWIVVVVYGVITVVTLLSFTFFTKTGSATRTGSPRQVLACDGNGEAC